MEVVTHIRRADILRFNVFQLPRAKPNLVFFALVAAGVFAWSVIDRPPLTFAAIAASALVALVVAGGGLLAGFVVSTLVALVTSDATGGVLGQHTYTLTPEGLHEVTPVNEGLQRWSGVQQVGKSRAFLHVRTNGGLYHLIPRRAFPSDDAFDAFHAEALRLWKAARGF